MAIKYPENKTYSEKANKRAMSSFGSLSGLGRRAAKKPRTTLKRKPRVVPQQKDYKNIFKGLGTQTVPYGGSTRYEKFHPGIDIANKIGTPVPAFVGGKVTDIKTGQEQTPDKPSFGNYVIITDKDGNKHRYSHLNRSYVQLGQEVAPGAVLGQMGNTGSTYSEHGGTGSHLDYRITDAYNKYVNPISYIKQVYSYGKQKQ